MAALDCNLYIQRQLESPQSDTIMLEQRGLYATVITISVNSSSQWHQPPCLHLARLSISPSSLSLTFSCPLDYFLLAREYVLAHRTQTFFYSSETF